MNIILSVKDAVVASARKSAEALGLNLNRVVRNYLSGLAGHSPREAVIAEVERLSAQAGGHRAGWGFCGPFDRKWIHRVSVILGSFPGWNGPLQEAESFAATGTIDLQAHTAT